jgi:predicted permease
VIPLQGGGTYLGGLEPEGYEAAPGERISAGMNVVTPGYFDLTRIQLLRGRDFSEEDQSGSEPAIVVNQAFVDRFWPGESGVGKWVGSGKDLPYRVVGVVENIASQLPGEEPEAMIWLPFSQFYLPEMILHVRTTGNPQDLFQSLRDQVTDLNPQLPVTRLDRMEVVTANATLAHRILSAALGTAGALALALAMLGIYGVVSYSVSHRTREVGLRLALGAEAGEVIRMVVREGFTLALIGLIPGIVLSLAAARLMRSILMGLSPLDPVAFGGSIALLLVSVLVAAVGPARRAARADPMEALREE